MLDDLKYIHQRDGQDALGVAEKQWQQLQYKFEIPQITGEFENIVLAGMGGSALGGVYLQSWPDLTLPFEIARNYSLPNYVNQKTLVIVSSYSGNTEETISALNDAENKKASIIVLSAGGKLTELTAGKYPLIKTPEVSQPRMSAFYVFNALVTILEKAGLVKDKVAELNEAGGWSKNEVSVWRPDVSTKDNQAKQIAMELAGKTAIIYSGPKLFPAANKFKIWINENAKNLAWANQYPEFNHNEFIGWSSHPIEKPFAVVEIRSNLEHPRTQKRFAVTERLLSGKRPSPIVIEPKGDSLLKQLVWASALCDFASIYLALLNNLNPTPVDLVERFKKELG